MSQEERELLPAFDALAHHAAPNQAPAVVRRDHRLVEALLAELEAAEDPIARTTRLGRLADVLDHHDRREAAGMLPILDAHAADLVPIWLAAIHAEEDALPAHPGDLATGARRPLPPPDPDPLRALVAAAALDHDVASPFARLPVPDHPKGPRLHALLAEAVSAAASADLGARRDALGDVVDRARLVELVRS